MRRYTTNYTWLLLIFLVGCSTISQEKVRDIDRKIGELSQASQTLEKKIDDLSRSVSLLVSDGNELHNELDVTKTTCKDNQQKIEDVAIVIKNIDNRIECMGADFKAAGEEMDKRLDGLEKDEIELSNRLEIMKFDMRGADREKTASPALP